MTNVKSHEDLEKIIKEMIAISLKPKSADHDTDDSAAAFRARMIESIQNKDQDDGTTLHH